MVQNLRIETNPVHHIVENPLEFLGDSVLLTAEVVGIIARHALPPAGAPGLVPRSAQAQLTRVVEIAQGVQEGLGIIQTLNNANHLNDERLLEIVEPITRARQIFEEAYGSAVSRLQRVCARQSQCRSVIPAFLDLLSFALYARPEDIMEAVVAIRKMTLLFPSVEEALRVLATTLQKKRKNTKILLGAGAISGGLAALYAATFFLGPSVIAGCWIYGWVTAGTTSSVVLAGGGIAGAVGAPVCGSLLLERVLNDAERSQQLKDAGSDVQAALWKLQPLLAAYWVRNAWKIDLAESSDPDREEYLSSLGVDPRYFGQREYDLAQLRDRLDELVLRYNTLRQCFDRLYTDLRIEVDMQAQEPVI